MSHLSPSELVDLVDGTLLPSREAHARGCARCRDEAARARLALEDARSVEAPEPSPWFWEHFASRVQEAVRSDPPPARWTVFTWRPAPMIAVAATIILVVGALWYVLDRSAPPDAAQQQAIVLPEAAPAPQDTPLEGLNGDAGWDLVALGAESLEWEDVTSAGFSIRPGAAERAALELSEEQQAELRRLLEAEIGRLSS
jgi:hypothetical protein